MTPVASGLIKEEFDRNISKFEEVLQKTASDIASGVLFERLPPAELLKKTESQVNTMIDLAASCGETMLALKPEKTPTVQSMQNGFAQTLATYRNILLQNTTDPLANSRLAFEQLRKALTDGSDFLLLMREVRDNPSPLMSAIVTLKKVSEAKGSVISIQASEEMQPLIKHVLGRIDEIRAAVAALETKVSEMKKVVQELQEESLKILTDKASKPCEVSENKAERKQLFLSNFKTEGSAGGGGGPSND